MGRLVHLGTNTRCTLRPRHLVGRSRRSDLRVQHTFVSGEHATLWWTGTAWWLRDLGSRNGTSVDGAEVPPREPRALAEGAVVRFGHDDNRWRLEDAGGPIPVAVAPDGSRTVRAVDGLLCLPDADLPDAMVYRGPDDTWLCEDARESRRVTDLDEVDLPSGRWRLHLPEPLEETDEAGAGGTLDAARLEFEVSADEESVRAWLVVGPARHDLEERTHHSLLLYLARACAADATQGVEPAERGWEYRDELARKLGVDVGQVAQLLFRARRQVAAHGLSNAGQLVEVRRMTRQVRLAIPGVEPAHPGR